MEYLEGCSTTIRHVARKVAAVEGRLVWFGGGFTTGTLFLDRWTCIWYDLLSGGALICYTEFWFTFETWIIDDLIDFRNIFRGKFGKSFLNLNDFTDIAFRELSVSFAIGVRIWWQGLIFLIKFGFGQNTFARSKKNWQRNSWDICLLFCWWFARSYITDIHLVKL